MLDPNDKHHYVINPETAPIVRRMFNMAANGSSIHSIARTFTEEGILSPADILKGAYTGVEWSVTSVGRMLKNKVYLGYMIYNKQCKPSFKSQKIIRMQESEWVLTPDRHEPLVDQEVFDLVQKRVGVKKRKNSHDFENVFVGVVKCVDCGTNMSLAKDYRSGIFYLNCHKYRKFTEGNRCTTHYINYEFLYELVLAEIRENITVMTENEHRMDDFIRERLRSRAKRDSKDPNKTTFAKLTHRKDELDKIIERLFESSALSSLSSEHFHEMLAKYTSERNEVISRLEKSKTPLSDKTEDEADYQRLFKVLKKYQGEECLSSTMLNELVERIDVHESNGGRVNRKQKVEIHYRFIDEGLAESPEK